MRTRKEKVPFYKLIRSLHLGDHLSYCFTVFSKWKTTSLCLWYQQSRLWLINKMNNTVAISSIFCLCCCQLPLVCVNDLHALTVETNLWCWPRIRMHLIFAPVLVFEFLSAVINYKPSLPGLLLYYCFLNSRS